MGDAQFFRGNRPGDGPPLKKKKLKCAFFFQREKILPPSPGINLRLPLASNGLGMFPPQNIGSPSGEIPFDELPNPVPPGEMGISTKRRP